MAELYLPSSARHMPITPLPDWKFAHVVSKDGLLCDGYSCLKWSPDTGSWEAAGTLDIGRDYLVSWTPANSSDFYLMGGGDSFEESMDTTTLIKPDGTQEPGFLLKYFTK